MDADDRIDELLMNRRDDNLGEDAKRELEELARQSPEIQRAIETDDEVDRRIKSLFAPPAPAGRLQLDKSSSGQRLAWRRYAKLAAIIAVATSVGVAAVMYIGLRPPTRQSGPAYALHTEMDAGTLHARLAARGFEPDWVCETEAQFAKAVEQDLGVPIAMPFDDPDLTILGWTYLRRVRPDEDASGRDLLLMLRDSQGREILVAMGKAPADPGRQLDVGDDADGLRVFRAQVEGVVLHEISPRAQPVAIDKLRVFRP